MAMYYYASKLSAIACGTRCKHHQHQQQHQQQQQQQQHHQHQHQQRQQQVQHQQQQLAHQLQMQSEAEATTATTAGGGTNNSALSAEMSVARGGGGGGGDGGGGPHRSFATRHQQQGHQRGQHRGSGKRQTNGGDAADGADFSTLENASAVLGSGGIMYCGGNIISGPQDSLVDLLMPSKTEDLDKEFIFSFLLSSRLFVRPHELLGRLLGAVSTEEPLDRLVGLLGIWTNTFPYDFRDERIMCHVKHIAARCANTSLGDVVSELLSALLNRLTELEQHEKELRVSHALADETEMEDKLPSATQLAQLLCLIERKMAKHVGPEEFVQYSSASSHLNKKSKKSEKSSTSTTTTNGTTATALTNGTPTDDSPNALDPKKTCNLESYLEWSARLRTLVANEVLLCNGIRDRSKSVELWSGVAQYCLLVGNYNSATAILESLESPAIGRLQTTWSKLSSTSQQLDCMQRHADGCGDLWHKQTGNSNQHHPNQYHGQEEKQQLKQQQSTFDPITDKSDVSCSIMSTTGTTTTATATASNIGGGAIAIVPATGGGKVVAAKPPPLSIPKPPSTDWVVIPVFADIVRLAVLARDDCQIKLPNGHLNVEAFNRLAAVVGAFTKHMCDTLQNSASAQTLTKPSVRDEYQKLSRRMQNCTLQTDTDLMLASFDCEQPSSAEKEAFNLT